MTKPASNTVKPRVGATLASFPNALRLVSEVATRGHISRGGDWDSGRLSSSDSAEECTDSMQRHFLAEASGEYLDPTSGLPHAAHLAWNALGRLEAMIKQEQEANE